MKHTHHKHATPAPPEQTTAEPVAAAPSTVTDTTPADKPAKPELLEQLQRLQAEFENYRKRADAQIASAQETGRDKAIRDLLPIIDSIQLAKAHAQTADGAAELATGFTVIHSQLTNLLEHWGVEQVPSAGIVDPRAHEVYLTETIADTPAGTILQVLQPGYTRNGTVLRTAKVKAARN